MERDVGLQPLRRRRSRLRRRRRSATRWDSSRSGPPDTEEVESEGSPRGCRCARCLLATSPADEDEVSSACSQFGRRCRALSLIAATSSGLRITSDPPFPPSLGLTPSISSSESSSKSSSSSSPQAQAGSLPRRFLLLRIWPASRSNVRDSECQRDRCPMLGPRM